VEQSIAHSGDGLPRHIRVLIPETGEEALGGFAENEQLVEDGGLCLDVGHERGLVQIPAKLQGQMSGP